MQEYTLYTWLNESTNHIALLLLLALAFFLVECIRPIQPTKRFTTEKQTELFLALLNKLVVIPLTYIAVLFIFNHTLAQWIPYQMFNEQIQAMPFWVQLLLAVLLLDFIVYLRHRFTHVYLWRIHVIHHCTQYVNWLTSYRLHPLEVMLDLFFSLTVLYIVGFKGGGMEGAIAVMYLFNVFAHTNINFEWPGFLRYIFGSPNYHRWHHAKMEPEAFDKNFGVIFPFIDLAFGTYYYPKGQLPKEFGLYQREGEIPIPPTFFAHLRYPLLNKQSGSA